MDAGEFYLAAPSGKLSEMYKIINYLKDYFAGIDKRAFGLSALFTAFAIYLNYRFGLNDRIFNKSTPARVACWYGLFLLAFSFPYLLLPRSTKRAIFSSRRFLLLLIAAPLVFALKMAVPLHFNFSPYVSLNAYWNAVAYFPAKLALVLVFLIPLWVLSGRGETFWGYSAKGFSAKPYWIMLLIMVPLIAAASTQKDFLAMYPKMGHLSFLQGEGKGAYRLLYEIAYGTDFVTIETFFRGFLVLAFAKWAGRDAILPMAVFYCTIHFGKPLGECISSFFGGLILGVVTFHTRAIWGGLMVHLGIAWLMELGGYLGNQFLL